MGGVDGGSGYAAGGEQGVGVGHQGGDGFGGALEVAGGALEVAVVDGQEHTPSVGLD